jgi:hypothetical protein
MRFGDWGQKEKLLLITARNQKITDGIFEELGLK